MTVISELPELMLRSVDAAWDRAKWEQLPDDGNRYEIIDRVLYMATAPSAFTNGSFARSYAYFMPRSMI